MARIDQKTFYAKNYETYGVSAQGAAWDTSQTQQRRFATILSLLGEIGKDTLVDAGCGFGDFYLYLNSKKRLPKQYVGLDLCAHMVKEVKVCTGCKIVQKDILSQSIPCVDWYVVSRSINLLTWWRRRSSFSAIFGRAAKGLYLTCCREESKKGISLTGSIRDDSIL